MTLASISGAAPVGGKLVAVLGPTNTGKTHLAIERMLGHQSGVIGLPLRLLAAEVYGRVAARVGADQVALITGEEKVVPPGARYQVCTVEAMPLDTDASFLAIDEIQLAGDLERGHVFTDRILHLRGRDETLLLGAATMRGIVETLFPAANIVTRPRMSILNYSGSKKITRLPRRSAVVAFSADDVYAIAELVRRQRGGAAVVLGSLSPRARNAQVELFQSGDVDFLVATDAIGMGLNLDVEHVAFAADRKFDGFQFRRLTPAEFGQIAGRAGRHMRDGTFGVTSRVDPFSDQLVASLESHEFDPVRTVQWRSRDLDVSSIDSLRHSLDQAPQQPALTKAPPTADVTVLEAAARDPGIRDLAASPAKIAQLWEVCQVPDYRKIAPANHAELVTTIFTFLARDGHISEDWFADQVAFADRADGDIDTLANRVAHIRTWTFAANRPHWLADPAHWQERTRAVEDRLSDALHERLTARFVDRRTSVLLKRLREKAMLEADITADGDVLVEGQHVGTLAGFRFAPDSGADGPDAKALLAAASRALAGELAARAERLAGAANSDFILATDGTLRWQGAEVARAIESDDPLKPRLVILADDALTTASRERIQNRIDLWLAHRTSELLKPLFDLRDAEALVPAARGIAFRLTERFGTIERRDIAEEVRGLDQEARAGLRALGVRFGAHHIYIPQILKPAASALLATFWVLKNSGLDQASELISLAASGRTSFRADAEVADDLYRIVGYRRCGQMAIRVDILERLADLIRPLVAWRATVDAPEPPEGAVPGNGFTVTVAMTSLLGCSGDDFASVLRSLGYRLERRPKQKTTEDSRPEAQSDGHEGATLPAGDSAAEITLPESRPAEPPAMPDAAAASAPEIAALDVVTGIPQEAATPPDAPASEAAAPAIVPGPPPGTPMDKPAPTDAKPDIVPPPASGERPATETEVSGEGAGESPSQGAEAAPDAPSPEPEFIEIWRPQRSRRPGSRSGNEAPPGGRRRRGNHAKPAAEGQPERTTEGPRRRDRRPDKARERDRSQRKHRPAQSSTRGPDRPGPSKTADPDSPFAALAALKAELESQGREDT